MRHTFTLLLFAAILAATSPARAHAAAETFSCGGLTFSVTSTYATSCTVTGATASVSGTLTIPSEATSADRTYTVVAIGAEAFARDPHIEHISLPPTVRTIGSAAFAGCSALQDVAIPGTVRRIDDSAFAGCDALVTAVVGEGVEHVGYWAFEHCARLSSITLPGTLRVMMAGLCNGCTRLARVSMGNGLSNIAANAFSGCSGLRHIGIPASVFSIGANAFYGCDMLDEVCCRSAGPPQADATSFTHIGTLCVPEGSAAHYRAHEIWGRFDIVEESADVLESDAYVWAEGSRWDYYDKEGSLVSSYVLGSGQWLNGTRYLPLTENKERILAYIRAEQGDSYVYARVVDRESGQILPEVLLYDFARPYADGETIRLGTLRDDGSVGVDELRISVTPDAPIRYYDDVIMEGDRIGQWCNFIYLIGCFHGPLDYFYAHAADKQPSRKNISHLIFGKKRSTRTDVFYPFVADDIAGLSHTTLDPAPAACSSGTYDLSGRRAGIGPVGIDISGRRKSLHVPATR